MLSYFCKSLYRLLLRRWIDRIDGIKRVGWITETGYQRVEMVTGSRC